MTAPTHPRTHARTHTHTHAHTYTQHSHIQVAQRYPTIRRIIYLSTGVEKGLGGGASSAMWSAEEVLRASGFPYVIVRPTRILAEPGGSQKIEVASSYAGAMPAGVSTTAMDVADAVVTCLVMDEIFAKVCPSLDLLPVPLPCFRVCMSY